MKLVGTMLLGGMTRAELLAPARMKKDAQAASEMTATRGSGPRLADQIPEDPEQAPVVALHELKALIAAV